MNKLVLEQGSLLKELDSSIVCNEVDNLNIELSIKKDTRLKIISNHKEDCTVTINVDENVNFDLSILGKGFGNVQYNYNLLSGSNVNVKKLYDSDNINESIVINLNGYKASINYEFTTISSGLEKYNYMIYHNAKETVSNIINKGVNIKMGELVFDISSYVPNEINDCRLNQNSRIINLTNNKCQINPNLFIDENDVEANHSAHIGKFSDEEIFYLQSRGIDYETAYNLLIRGFLMTGNEMFTEETLELIEKYWR